MLLALSAAIALLPARAPAGGVEEPSPSVRLDLTLSRTPPIAPPSPAPEAVRKDIEDTVREILARERDEAAMRAAIPGPSLRPDLHYDVRSGLQSRHLRDALRR